MQKLAGRHQYRGHQQQYFIYAGYSQSDHRATLDLEAVDSDAGDAWYELSSGTIEAEVEDICEDVVDVSTMPASAWKRCGDTFLITVTTCSTALPMT